MVTLTLTVWQKRKVGMPTCAGEGRIVDPVRRSFDSAVKTLLAMVDKDASPFQIVAQVGDTSRSFQFRDGWNEDQVLQELWTGYTSIERSTS